MLPLDAFFLSVFTAAQAAQKCTSILNFARRRFTAAQAAQKRTKTLEISNRWFTAAQAAQKIRQNIT